MYTPPILRLCIKLKEEVYHVNSWLMIENWIWWAAHFSKWTREWAAKINWFDASGLFLVRLCKVSVVKPNTIKPLQDNKWRVFPEIQTEMPEDWRKMGLSESIFRIGGTDFFYMNLSLKCKWRRQSCEFQ